MSPTQRTLKYYRDQGLTCGIVEKFNPHVGPVGIRQDLFGFIDIVVLCPKRGIIGAQSTGQDFAGHLRKLRIEREQQCAEWLLCGGKIDLIGWRKLKLKRGGKAMRWTPRILEITWDVLFG